MRYKNLGKIGYDETLFTQVDAVLTFLSDQRLFLYGPHDFTAAVYLYGRLCFIIYTATIRSHEIKSSWNQPYKNVRSRWARCQSID